MKLEGSRVVRAAPEEIWAFLLTPERLRQCLPGCERLAANGPDSYDATMRLGVAFFKGTYSGTIRVVDRQPPDRLTLAVEGGGALGSLAATGTVRFVPSGGATELLYDGQAHVGGMVASVGERVITLTAHKLFSAFLDCLASHVEPRP